MSPFFGNKNQRNFFISSDHILVIRLIVKKDFQKPKYAHRENVMETTDFEGKEIVYSANRVVEYFGNDTPVCIYYENRDELPEGDYAVDIFANGKLIGSTSFNLR